MSGIIEQERYTCAIGALQSVVAIKKAVPVLHSGPGCGEMIAGFFERSTGYAGGPTSPCTNFSEREVVFGGLDKLREIISNTRKVLDVDLIVILTGCTAGIVGDDVDSLAEECREAGLPVVSVETAGFKCNNYEAHSLVVNAIIDQYVTLYEDENPARSDADTVNLIASLPYQDPFWKRNLWEYKRLLAGIGLRANVLFGPEADGVQEWQSIPRANFNVVVSPWYGIPIAEHLQELYGQPYTRFGYVPIGANETEKWLRSVIDFATENGVNIDTAKAEAFIKKESEAYYEEIDNLATFLLEFRYGLPNHVHIFQDAGYVVGLSKFLLHEVGIIPRDQFITDNTPESFRDAISADMKATSDKRDIPLYFEPDAGKAQDILRKNKAPGRGIILGSGWDKELAKELDCDFVSIALPSPYRLVMCANYVGFSGGLRVIEDIYDVSLGSYN